MFQANFPSMIAQLLPERHFALIILFFLPSQVKKRSPGLFIQGTNGSYYHCYNQRWDSAGSGWFGKTDS